MSLTQALVTAASGLRVTQSGLAVVAGNIANAQTAGYVRRTMDQVAVSGGGLGSGVRVSDINRELDAYIQRQLRTETAGGAYADLRAQFFGRLQQIYGDPGSATTLETAFNNLTTAVQSLATSPESTSARNSVLNSAQVLTQQLSAMTDGIQGLRTDAELGLADAVAKANDAMQQIARINQQLATSPAANSTTASLLDQRDGYIDQLSRLMDIRIVQNDHNQISVFTNSGVQLVGTEASQLSFDAQGTMTPSATWSADPALCTVGTIKLISPTGGDTDLIANKAIRSGQIAALLEMRDQTLVQAQTQLDSFSAKLAQSLSDRTTDGAAVVSGGQSGFDLDLGPLSAGNTISITYTDNMSGAQRKLTLVRVDDPGALPLADSATADPNDRVIGVDFSGGMSSVVSQLSVALATTGLQFSNPAGNTLRVLDDGFGKIGVDAASTTQTITGLTGGVELPLFLDAHVPFTGAISAQGSQQVGLAGRLAVNAALLADPSKLVVYQTSPLTPAGDDTRPSFLFDRLNGASLRFDPASGIGTAVAPYDGTLTSFIRQIASTQGEAAASAASLQQGQDVVVKSLQQRFDDSASVNVDEEMTNLLNLQNAYAANARVLGAVKEMLDALMNSVG